MNRPGKYGVPPAETLGFNDEPTERRRGEGPSICGL